MRNEPYFSKLQGIDESRVKSAMAYCEQKSGWKWGFQKIAVRVYVRETTAWSRHFQRQVATLASGNVGEFRGSREIANIDLAKHVDGFLPEEHLVHELAHALAANKTGSPSLPPEWRTWILGWHSTSSGLTQSSDLIEAPMPVEAVDIDIKSWYTKLAKFLSKYSWGRAYNAKNFCSKYGHTGTPCVMCGYVYVPPPPPPTPDPPTPPPTPNPLPVDKQGDQNFLWKETSETTGRPVVLIPAKYNGEIVRLTVARDRTLTEVYEIRTVKTPTTDPKANGNRSHWFLGTNPSGTGVVAIELKDGRVIGWNIPNFRQRKTLAQESWVD
jgi:hypothetical protein